VLVHVLGQPVREATTESLLVARIGRVQIRNRVRIRSSRHDRAIAGTRPDHRDRSVLATAEFACLYVT
jgi:hypothetical protein